MLRTLRSLYNEVRHYVVWVSVEAIKWLTEEYNSCSETVVTSFLAIPLCSKDRVVEV